MSAIAEIQNRLQDTNTLIVQYQDALALPENRASTASLAANIRGLEKLRRQLEDQFLEVAALEELDVYRYRIIESDERPTLAGIAEAWAKFQAFFGAVYAELTKTTEEDSHTKKQPKSVLGTPPELGYSYAFNGSVGVVITLPKRPQEVAMYTTSPTDDASKMVFDLIESRGIEEIALSLGPKPIVAMHDWLGVHVKHHYGLGLEWRADRQKKRSTEIQFTEVAKLQNTIADASTKTSLVIVGELRNVDYDKKVFRIIGDDSLEVEGTFGDAITPEQAASVPARYRAFVTKTTRLVSLKKGAPEVTHYLDKMESLRVSKDEQ